MGIVDKIKDERTRKRIQSYIDKFPRRLSHDNPTNNPQVAKMMEALFKEDDIICLPKDKTIKINVPVDREPDLLLPSKAIEHAIKSASHRVVMNFCICRESMQCKDYPINVGCIFMGDAAKKIHPELGRAATVDEALEVAARARDAGLVHSIGRSGIDPVWLEVGPAKKLLTVCNCCPCCCLTRTIPYSSPVLGRKYHRMPGVEVKVTGACNACGICESEACIFQAVKVKDGCAEIDQDTCRGCGRCAVMCPEGAIEVMVEDADYINRTIERIAKIEYT